MTLSHHHDLLKIYLEHVLPKSSNQICGMRSHSTTKPSKIVAFHCTTPNSIRDLADPEKKVKHENS